MSCSTRGPLWLDRLSITQEGLELREGFFDGVHVGTVRGQISQLGSRRKIAERTVTGLMNALETCAHIFKPAECVNYFKACGYDTD